VHLTHLRRYGVVVSSMLGEVSVLRRLVTYFPVSPASDLDSFEGILRIGSLFDQIENVFSLRGIILDSLNGLDVVYVFVW
jgi:hypothetical protein